MKWVRRLCQPAPSNTCAMAALMPHIVVGGHELDIGEPTGDQPAALPYFVVLTTPRFAGSERIGRVRT